MKRVILRCFVVALLVLITLPLLGGRIAMADEDEDLNELLDGDFAFTLTRICTNSAGGFDVDFNVPTGAGHFHSFSRGTRTYNGDGTGSIDTITLNILPGAPPAGNPVRQNRFTCNLTYQVNPDGSFIENTDCTAERLIGPDAGAVFDPLDSTIEGQIAVGGEVLILSETSPSVQNFTKEETDGTVINLSQVCGRSGIAVLITED